MSSGPGWKFRRVWRFAGVGSCWWVSREGMRFGILPFLDERFLSSIGVRSGGKVGLLNLRSEARFLHPDNRAILRSCVRGTPL